MEQLRSESSIIDFDIGGEPADNYLVRFYGKGLWRAAANSGVLIRELHEVRIVLGASYPRMMPEIRWGSPIFHPNISASGVVCLGGYGTHWVPSLSLDELCGMLWDMIRYQNYDVDSPYNREAALWAKSQDTFRLPLDIRPIRDRLARTGTGDVSHAAKPRPPAPAITARPLPTGTPEVMIIDDQDDEIINAEVVDPDDVDPEDQDIMFLD